MRTFVRILIVAAFVCPTAVRGQQPLRLTRAEAIAAAVNHGPRAGLGRADTALASARLLTAGAIPNPALAASYTKDVPSYHVTAEFPLGFLTVRGLQVKSAEAAQAAARYRFTFDQALLSLDADTTYTRALAAQAHVALSARNAVAADSLHRIAIARRDAGDASDLDVELATVYAGQQANLAAADTLALTSSLLDLQALLGTPGNDVRVVLADSLGPPATRSMATGAASTSLPVRSAAAALESADLALRVEHRSVFMIPGLLLGFDTGDPGGTAGTLLPVIGLTVPLPLFNRNKGPIAAAQAERDRADAELAVSRSASDAALARATREERGALARVDRDRLLVTSAERVATMSLAAYREGAAPLASVLEAQRNARDVLGQYIDDVASALVASATLRTLVTPPTSGSQP